MNKDKYDKGLKVRVEVVGEEYVKSAIKNATDFNRPMQELITEYCWGEVWARPELPRKTRSMINLAMLTALNRPNELKLHIEGSLRNGVTQEEIREIFLQSIIYCGVPAGVESFKIAQEIFNEMEEKGGY